mgnify:CR=1 FL=1
MEKIKFVYSFIRDLNNNNTQVLYQNIFELIDEVNIDNEDVLEVVEDARKHLNSMVDLGKKTLAHKNTNIIKNLIMDRRNNLIAIKKAVDGFLRIEAGATQTAADKLNYWLLNERVNIGSQAIVKQEGVAQRLIDEKMRDSEIGKALEALNLLNTFEEVEELSKQITRLSQERISEKNKAKKIRDEKNEMSYEDMVNLLKTLELKANRKNTKDREVYHNLCMNINTFLVEANADKKAESTRGKNREDSDAV